MIRTYRGLSSELVLESLEGGGGSLLLSRGKGSSRGDEGGKDGGLHGESLDENCA